MATCVCPFHGSEGCIMPAGYGVGDQCIDCWRSPMCVPAPSPVKGGPAGDYQALFREAAELLEFEIATYENHGNTCTCDACEFLVRVAALRGEP